MGSSYRGFVLMSPLWQSDDMTWLPHDPSMMVYLELKMDTCLHTMFQILGQNTVNELVSCMSKRALGTVLYIIVAYEQPMEGESLTSHLGQSFCALMDCRYKEMKLWHVNSVVSAKQLAQTWGASDASGYVGGTGHTQAPHLRTQRKPMGHKQPSKRFQKSAPPRGSLETIWQNAEERRQNLWWVAVG